MRTFNEMNPTVVMMLAYLIAFTTGKTLSKKSEGMCMRSPQKIINACKGAGDFMLTFDDGLSDNTHNLLEKLDEEGVKATMFINGNNGRCIYDYADELQAAFRAGHTIGSHTWTHTAPHLLTGPMMEEELDKTEEAMVKILGVKPKLYMPPYGIIDTKNANVSAGFEVLHKRGYTIVYWTVTANSGDDEGAAYALTQFDKFLNQDPLPRSGISVSLDPNEEVVTGVISQAIAKLVDHNFKIVDAKTCLKVRLYDHCGHCIRRKHLPKRDDTWKC